MIACAYCKPKSNHYLVNIYNSLTGEHINTLKGHGNTVTDILWD